MTEWRSLTAPEVADLAVRLQSLEWSWLLTDVPALAAEFGWAVERIGPSSARLDTGFGMASGEVSGGSEHPGRIRVQVTDFADDDAAGRAWVRDAFTDMAIAITGALGPPTLREPGKEAEIRWAGAQTTVRLWQFTSSVSLFLMTNALLAAEDEITEMDEKGLL